MLEKQRFWSSDHAFTIMMIAGIAAGAALGLMFGPKATIFKPIGQLFINLLFTLVVPLVFFSISGAVAALSDMKRLGKLLSSTLGIFIFTGVIASVLAIVLIKGFDPVQGLVVPNLTKTPAASLSIGEHIVKMFTVNDFSLLLSKNNMLPLIVFAIFFGMSVSMLRERGVGIGLGLNALAEVCYKMVGVLMRLAPIGLGAYFANLTGVFGPQLLGAYGKAMLFFYPVAIGYFFIFNPLYCYMSGGMECIKAFFKNCFTPAVTAFGTCSSSACIPVQRAFCDRVGVPADVSGVVLPMGATMHMDGSCLGVIMKIYVACLVFQVPWTGFETYALSVLLAVASATAISAVPGGGAIGSVLIVSVMGLPDEALPIVIMLGSLIDPAATLLNSVGDTVAAFMVTRILEGRNWMAKNLSGKQDVNW